MNTTLRLLMSNYLPTKGPLNDPILAEEIGNSRTDNCPFCGGRDTMKHLRANSYCCINCNNGFTLMFFWAGSPFPKDAYILHTDIPKDKYCYIEII